MPSIIRRFCNTVVAAALVTISMAHEADAEIRNHFDVPAQPLGMAIRVLAAQADTNVMFDEGLVKGRRAERLQMASTLDEALSWMLAGTGLTHRFLNEHTVLVAVPEQIPAPAGDDDPQSSMGQGVHHPPSESRQVRLAQGPAGEAEETTASQRREQRGQPAHKNRTDDLEEIVVTGTHLRGGSSISPVMTFDRRDFDRSGVATAQQFFARLPQNFGGGQTDDTAVNEGASNQANPAFGTAINLRGLGSSSTLVLINGSRAAAGGTAEFVDISMIPLNAVERIEVLPDGASAIYGSDAVGGVVNFIMRTDFAGAETRLRGGASTRGGAGESQIGQVLATEWGLGNALVSYEFYRRDALNSMDREFSKGALGPLDLVPLQTRNSVYASAQHSVSEDVRLFGNLLFTRRKADYAGWDQGLLEIQHTRPDTKQYGVVTGVTFDLGDRWELEVSSDASRNSVDALITSPTLFGGFGNLSFESEYDLWSADAKLTGQLFTLPGGAARLAFGASHRQESFSFSQNTVDGIVIFAPTEHRMSNDAVFSELTLPILPTSSSSYREPQLLVSAAARFERYQDFGDTFDPRFGIRWAPSSSLALRGTWGTSFKAPNAYQLNDFNASYGIRERPDPQSASGMSRTLSLVGNSPDLHEETATTWSAGLDWAPALLPDFRAQLTYFDVRYKDRIQEVLQPINLVLSNPAYASLVIRRGDIPDSEFDQAVGRFLAGPIPVAGCSTPLQEGTNACLDSPNSINALVDRRLFNIASMSTNGVDLILTKHLTTSVGSFELRLNSTYLFSYQQRLTSAVSPIELLDTAHNPLRFRGSTGLNWNRSGWSVSGTLSFTDEYDDVISSPTARIASWTTFDLNARYEFAASSGLLAHTSASLSIQNVFDRNPPFLSNQYLNLGYDPSNAEPFGRLISVLLTKSW